MKLLKKIAIFSLFIILSACGDSGDEKVSKGHRDAIHIQCKDDPNKKLCGLEVREAFLEDGYDFVTLDELNEDQIDRVKMNCVRSKKYGLVSYNNCLEKNLQAALDGKLTQGTFAEKPKSNIEELESSVVFILLEEYNSKTEEQKFLGHGSGIIISNKEIATNCHVAMVVEEGKQTNTTKRFIWVKNLGPKTKDSWAMAKITKKNTKNDICIIESQKVEKMKFKMKPINKFVKFKDLRRGETVRTMGSPEGLMGHTDIGSINWLGTANDAMLPSEQIDPETKLIIHDAVIKGGSSGGPLFDNDGNIIGLNTMGRDQESIAVSSDHIREILYNN